MSRMGHESCVGFIILFWHSVRLSLLEGTIRGKAWRKFLWSKYAGLAPVTILGSYIQWVIGGNLQTGGLKMKA